MRSVIAAIPEEELLALAGRFAEPPGGAPARVRLHARDGVLAATDGRILLHVESPAVRDIDGSSARIVGFRPEQATKVAGADWVTGALAPAVAEKCARAEKRIRAEREKAELEARARAISCPHCGREVVVEDGDLIPLDEYLADYLPDMRHGGPAVWLRFGNDRLARKLNLHYLATALDAARRLGGDAELWIGEGIQVILRGEGYFVIIAKMRSDGHDDENDIDIDVPKEEMK